MKNFEQILSDAGITLTDEQNVDLNECYYNIKDTEVEPEYYQTPEFTLIDSLNKIGADSSFKNRAYIAVENGIHQYTGTKEQNLKMLELLNAGKLVKKIHLIN